jgi:hypothetical protein
MKYGLQKAMSGMLHASHKWNCFNVKEQRKGRKGE